MYSRADLVTGWTPWQGRKWLDLGRVLTFLLAVGMMLPGLFSAAAAPVGPVSHRWLIVLETSSAMRAEIPNIQATLQQMAAGGMGGQMRPGDSIGIWTFNQKLQTGEFPLYHWAKDSPTKLPEILGQFVASRKYEKRAQFPQVMPALTKLMADLDLLTVVLVLSGESAVSGTAIDTNVNDFFDKWKKEQQKSKMPFVIVLRGYRRVFTDFSLNTPPAKTQFPPLPEEVTATKSSAPVAASPAAKVPPLIVIGKKPEPAKPPPAQVVTAPATNSLPATNPVPVLATSASPAAGFAQGASTNVVPASVPPLVGSNVTLAANAPTNPAVSAPIPSTNTSRAEPILPEPLVASARSGGHSSRVIWFAAAAGSLLLCAAAWIYRRRSRSGRHLSLITESLDRQGR